MEFTLVTGLVIFMPIFCFLFQLFRWFLAVLIIPVFLVCFWSHLHSRDDITWLDVPWHVYLVLAAGLLSAGAGLGAGQAGSNGDFSLLFSFLAFALSRRCSATFSSRSVFRTTWILSAHLSRLLHALRWHTRTCLIVAGNIVIISTIIALFCQSTITLLLSSPLIRLPWPFPFWLRRSVFAIIPLLISVTLRCRLPFDAALPALKITALWFSESPGLLWLQPWCFFSWSCSLAGYLGRPGATFSSFGSWWSLLGLACFSSCSPPKPSRARLVSFAEAGQREPETSYWKTKVPLSTHWLCFLHQPLFAFRHNRFFDTWCPPILWSRVLIFFENQHQPAAVFLGFQ